MRRAVVLLVGAVVGLVPLASPASAGDGHARGGDRRPPVLVTGTVSATGTWDYAVETCGFVREQLSGSYDATHRRFDDGTFTLDLCVTVGGGGFPLVGTFTVATDDGVRLSGTASGLITVPDVIDPTGLPLDLDLVVTGSSGTRRPVTGTISITGRRTEPGSHTSAVAGTFIAELRL